MSDTTDKIRAATVALSEACNAGHRLRVTTPARPTDHDVVIHDALTAASDELRRLRDALAKIETAAHAALFGEVAGR